MMELWNDVDEYATLDFYSCTVNADDVLVTPQSVLFTGTGGFQYYPRHVVDSVSRIGYYRFCHNWLITSACAIG